MSGAAPQHSWAIPDSNMADVCSCGPARCLKRPADNWYDIDDPYFDYTHERFAQRR